MCLRDVRLVHGSPPNTSDDRRIGFAIRYIPTHLRQLFGDDGARLVRGEDRYGHFALEPGPKRDMDPDLLALHQAIIEDPQHGEADGRGDPSLRNLVGWRYLQ